MFVIATTKKQPIYDNSHWKIQENERLKGPFQNLNEAEKWLLEKGWQKAGLYVWMYIGTKQSFWAKIFPLENPC